MGQTGSEHAPLTVTQADLQDDAVMLDVRESDEWALGHAPGAVHIPLGDLASRLPEVPQRSPLVVVCRSGQRSDQAAAFLRKKGFDAVNFEGGMLSWYRASRPMLHDGPGHPEVR